MFGVNAKTTFNPILVLFSLEYVLYTDRTFHIFQSYIGSIFSYFSGLIGINWNELSILYWFYFLRNKKKKKLD